MMLCRSSSDKGVMSAVAWSYPQGALLALKRKHTAAEAARPVASGIEVEQLSFNYVITGDDPAWRPLRAFDDRSEEHTSELQSLMRISYAVFCLKKKQKINNKKKKYN